MPTKIVIKKNTYFDSVSLMSVSTKANKLPGVEQAFVAMATEMNKGVPEKSRAAHAGISGSQKWRPDDRD
ncbi:Membrane protein FdrA [Enterobacter roggenkampii]